MEYKKINTRIRLDSELWNAYDKEGAGKPFIQAGIDNTQEIMDMRIYEMLSVFDGERIEAEDMLFALFYFFNVNGQVDDEAYAGLNDPNFDEHEWICEHPISSRVLVKEIILPVGMNDDALYWLFDQIVREYWRSPEYDPQLFWDRKYMRMMRSYGLQL